MSAFGSVGRNRIPRANTATVRMMGSVGSVVRGMIGLVLSVYKFGLLRDDRFPSQGAIVFPFVRGLVSDFPVR